MRNNRILSLDPGGTTGWAIIEYSDTEEPKLLDCGQVANGLEGFIDWYSKIDDYELDGVICESFTLRLGVKFPDLSPVYIIGALNAFEYNRLHIVMQPPTMKPLCSDEVLKRINFYQVGLPHGNDAIRHGIIYLRNKRNRPTLKLAWQDNKE